MLSKQEELEINKITSAQKRIVNNLTKVFNEKINEIKKENIKLFLIKKIISGETKKVLFLLKNKDYPIDNYADVDIVEALFLSKDKNLIFTYIKETRKKKEIINCFDLVMRQLISKEINKEHEDLIYDFIYKYRVEIFCKSLNKPVFLSLFVFFQMEDLLKKIIKEKKIWNFIREEQEANIKSLFRTKNIEIIKLMLESGCQISEIEIVNILELAIKEKNQCAIDFIIYDMQIENLFGIKKLCEKNKEIKNMLNKKDLFINLNKDITTNKKEEKKEKI